MELYKNSLRLAENVQWFKIFRKYLSIMRPYTTGVNVPVGNFRSPDQKQAAVNDTYAASGASFSYHQHINCT
jgi:hypothetical protein